MANSETAVDSLARMVLDAMGSREPCAADLQQLRLTMDQAEISPECYLLLPLLTGLTARLAQDDPLAGKLQGIKRLTWYKNQLILDRYTRLQAQLHAAGIPTLLLGDLASALLLYTESFLRPVHDLTVLVHSSQSADAADLLSSQGWEACHDLLPVNRNFLPGQRFRRRDFECELELLWHVFPVCLFPGSDDACWSRARSLPQPAAHSLVLAPTDLMLYLSVQAFFASRSKSRLWIADTVRLIQASMDEIEWPQLLKNARRRRLVAPAKQMIDSLSRNPDLQLPHEIVRLWPKERPSHSEWLEACYRRKPASSRLPGNLPLLWFDYRRWRCEPGHSGDRRIFAAYLTHYWQVDGSMKMLAMASRLVSRRVATSCRKFLQYLRLGKQP